MSGDRLEFLGRLDEQVKIRGFRVEPAEVEAALRLLPEVQEAVVVRHPSLPADRPLVAYYVAASGRSLSPDTVRRHLQSTLPEYMAPAVVLALGELPLNGNGKVDRARLPVPSASESTVHPAPGGNDAEARLLAIWRRVFERADIGVHDNFFELGGHSLLAMQVVAEVEREFACRLDIASLFHVPTIAQLSRRLDPEAGPASWTSLVPLQPAGARRPVYLVHGVNGGVYGYRDLVRFLGADQPVFGLQAVGLDGDVPRHTTIEEMAAHYVREVRSFQPRGPYALAGYSMGGLIAYEMARQLQAAGGTVAPLVLLDTEPIGGLPMLTYARGMAHHIPRRLWHHLRRWRRLPTDRRAGYLKEGFAGLGRLLGGNRAKPRITRPPDPGRPVERLPGFASYYHAVAVAYRLLPCAGPLELVLSDEANPDFIKAWDRMLSGGVRRHRVAGGHTDILHPPVAAATAAVLRRLLDDAAATSR